MSTSTIKYNLIIIMLFTFPPIGAFAASNQGEAVYSSGFYRMTLPLNDSINLHYGLYIPSKVADSKSIPLILALHYGGKVTPFYGLDYMQNYVAPALGDMGAIIIAPDCPHQNWKSNLSEIAILHLIDHIKSLYPIDENRIAITGFSMGAMGTWHHISKNPTLYSAAIVVAGRVDKEDWDTIPEIPIYIIHSDIDNVLPYGPARDVYLFLRKKKYPVRFATVYGVNHYDTAGFIPSMLQAAKWLKRVWRRIERG